MSSSRKYSVRRHIENYNIHNGSGKVVSFVEYSVGRREGYYQAQHAPQYSKSQPAFLDKIYDKIEKELENLIAKDIAQRIYDRDYSTDEQLALNLEGLARSHIVRSNLYKIMKALMS